MKAQFQLGKVITEPLEHKRDAVHIPVAEVKAAQELRPGQRVGFVHMGDHTLVGAGTLVLVGMVDPWMDRNIQTGERFLMLLKPNSVTDLVHVWDHPAFGPANEETVQEEEQEEEQEESLDSDELCCETDWRD